MQKTILILLVLLFTAGSVFADYIQIGNPAPGMSSTTNDVPFDGSYDYGWSRVIYLQSEIGGPIQITKISYFVYEAMPPSNYYTSNQQIYMKHTTDDYFTSTAYEDASSYTQVYDWGLNWNGGGWHDITLDFPFDYNGTDNLIIFYQNRDGTLQAGDPRFRYTYQEDRSLYRNAYDSYPAYSGAMSDYALVIRLHYTPAGAPGVPENPNPANGAGSIAQSGNLTWDFGSDTDTYDLWFGEAGNMSQVASSATAGTSGSYAYSDLEALTDYEWQVIAYNNDTGISTSGDVWDFTTQATIFSVPFSEGFEGDVSSWLMGGTNSSWEIDIPGGAEDNDQTLESDPENMNHQKTEVLDSGIPDPATAYSGMKCAGNDLTGDGFYNASETSYLLSPQIDCTSQTDVLFSFWRYLNVENSYDEVYLDITSDGTNWVTLNHPLYVQESAWTEVSFDISAQAAGNIIQIRWRLASDGSNQYSGWNIDNVLVTGPTIAVPENLTINIGATGIVVLNWDEITNASSYHIYACDTPDGTFVEITGEGTLVGESWTSNAAMGDQKFFRITADTEVTSQ
ncbi:MAG: hypothetical protein K9N09_08815 [Candidatus Cloacimonetes bacterium]|nr:hypothetical protein [Candidatus Cloacimonadota bacterium]MCF7814437.1 hypothetical protein [Candidatus Cloacimonadota bacterium]MCF7868787.1 hypothetical protein [Candidatus Cloacimonadota bacterium]